MSSYNERKYNKCNCPCGGRYLIANKALHSRSKRHQRFLDTGEVFVPKMPYRISSKRLELLNDEEKRIKRDYYRAYNKNKKKKNNLIVV